MSGWYPGCGCGNWWNNAPLGPCGPFEEPEVPDEGRCAPKPVRRTCEAPALPTIQCNDDLYEVISQPENESHPFAIRATLFDACCQAITDASGDPIMLVITQMGGYPSGNCET